MTLQACPEAVCKVCDKPFLRFRTTQSVCGPRCAQRSVKADKRKEAEETRARRIALRSRRDWLADTQKAFNAYIRARDADERCISCGKNPAAWGSWDAGHYLTVGARPELRFTPDNCHKQCVKCNQHLHGNAIMYRVGLIERIGLEAVEALEGPHPPAKWSIDELKTMRDAFRLLRKACLEQASSSQLETAIVSLALDTPEPASPEPLD